MNNMLRNVWFMSMIVLLLCSNVIPGAFNAAFIIFHAPFVIFGLNVLFSIVPNEIWFGFVLMCLFIYRM